MRRLFAVLLMVVVISSIGFWGCGSSKATAEKDAMASELEAARQKLDALSNENSQLKQQLSRLEQENRNLTAKTAQLETLLDEERSKPKNVPEPISEPTKNIITSVDIEYQTALTLFKQRKYSDAASKLQNILKYGVRDDLADNCYYWLGEAYFGMKDYQNAIANFEKVFTYKVSEKKDDAAIMIANAYWEMGNKKEAVKEYKKFLEKFPASPYVKRAKARISE